MYPQQSFHGGYPQQNPYGGWGQTQPVPNTGSFYGAPQHPGYYGQTASQPHPGYYGGAPPPSFQQSWYSQYYNQISPNEYEDLKKWFTTVDRDGNGHIEAQELQALTFGGVNIRYETARKLVKIFDRDYSGTIDFYEYASLHKFITCMQHAFIAGDTDKNGTLDSREIHNALRFARSPSQSASPGFCTFPFFFSALSLPVFPFSQFVTVAHIACISSCFLGSPATHVRSLRNLLFLFLPVLLSVGFPPSFSLLSILTLSSCRSLYSVFVSYFPLAFPGMDANEHN